MTHRLIRPDQPSAADRETVLAPLRAYNIAQAGDPRIQQVAILIDGAEGGLWGRISYDWLFVELLAVPEAARGTGLGRQLMDQAETIAREAGCTGIWLDTYEFQARGFYEKLGFTLFGTLPDHPVGQSRFFMMKRLV
ncbi:GCN5 family acetyltransferase [Novosphingobium sp. FSW06-99]|nr:GCN5 family acetyltransferase [Novosphingobium sp. FSW06-99]